MRISQIEKYEAKGGVDLADQTYYVHEYLYGCMLDIRPTWKPKWDEALSKLCWDDIRKLMSAIIALLPEVEQTILEPAMKEFEPWIELHTFMPSVWILDRHGSRHGHIGLLITAKDKVAALEQIRKRGYELRCW